MDNIKDIIKNEIDIIKEDFYKALKENISIPSEKNEGGEDEPFGEYPKKALEHVLDVGENLGFKGDIVNNAVAYLQYGEGEDYIGVVGHLDIVEAGNGWDTDPYNLVLKDGKFYAHAQRGGRRLFAGYFDTIEEAITARIEMSIELMFHENHGGVR